MNAKAKPGEAYVPTLLEHTANILTHFSIVIPSLFAAIRIFHKADVFKERLVVLIYGLAIILLFTTSSMFHILSLSGRYKKWKEIFHVGDRAVIYIFIASSYTPWLVLRHFEQRIGDTFLWITWIGALFGISYQCLFLEMHKTFETILYVIIASFPSLAWCYMIDLTGTLEMLFGGFVYAVGVIFFRSDGKIPFAHAIWHLFVLVGATVHYYAVYSHLLVDAD